MDTKTALKIALEIKAYDSREAARAIMDAEDGDDFRFTVDRDEYRVIHDDAIERIHDDEIREMVDDCYLSDESIPATIRRYFDYESFARDCRLSDGYGHHFSSYDGNEIEVGDYHVFRLN